MHTHTHTQTVSVGGWLAGVSTHTAQDMWEKRGWSPVSSSAWRVRGKSQCAREKRESDQARSASGHSPWRISSLWTIHALLLFQRPNEGGRKRDRICAFIYFLLFKRHGNEIKERKKNSEPSSFDGFRWHEKEMKAASSCCFLHIGNIY